MVFLLFDAARADYFSAYGQPDRTTPNIDEIARRGVLFKNHYSNSLNTRTSTSQLFTSRYEGFPILNYSEDMGKEYAWWMRDEILPRSATLYPRVLVENGYRAVMVSAHPFTTPDSILNRSFTDSFQVPHKEGEVYAPAAEVFDFADKYIAAHVRDHPDKPLFLYVHLVDTHLPHGAGRESDRFLTGEAKTWSKDERERRRPKSSANRYESLDQNAVALLRAEAKAAYAYLDQEVGQFVKRVENKLSGPILYVFTADHGDALGENNYVGHNFGTFAMEELHHVPLILSGRGTVPGGVVVEQLTATVDVFPTILDIARIAPERRKKIDGTTLLPLVRDRGRPGRNGVLSVMRLGWRTSRLGYHTRAATYIATERNQILRMNRGSGDFAVVGGYTGGSADPIPAEFRTLIADYRQRELQRQAIPRGKNLNVPVLDFALPRAAGHRCWAMPAWREYKDEFVFASAKGRCEPLSFSVPLLDGIYTGKWEIKSAKDCDPKRAAGIAIQTSGSAAPIKPSCEALKNGKIDLGTVHVRNGALQVFLDPRPAGEVTVGTMYLERTGDFPDAKKLSPEEIQRLKSLGYIQ